MPVELVMPKLGLNMEEGLLVEWLKKEGDRITKNDALFVVETDKVTNEYIATTNGILAKILIKGGETVPVRTVVGLITVEGETLDAAIPKTPEPAVKAVAVPQGPVSATSPAQSSGDKILASPVAKRIARENNIDLAVVTGTGPDGRIGQEDVERAIREREAGGLKTTHSGKTVKAGSSIPIEGIRAIIAERMLKSVTTTAQVTLDTEVDATNLVNWRAKAKSDAEAGGKTPAGYNAILVSLVAKALREHPALNAKQNGKSIELIMNINIGLAVDTEQGLVVVIVKDADKKSIPNINAELNILAERAGNKKSTIEDMTGGTFTITNLGGFGVDHFSPILNTPEVGILGVGRILEKLVVKNGKVMQRHMASFSLTFDHRLVDGAPAARFLQTLCKIVEEFN